MRNVHVPPRSHIRRALNRVERLEDAASAVHPAIDPSSPTRMPSKRVRADYLERFELVLRDYRRLLEGLDQ